MTSSELQSISVNQDGSCFACGLSTGFKVFSADPYRETYCRGFDNHGGIGMVEMLFRSNILAFVGGGPTPKYSPAKVMIWDDNQGKCIGELSFRTPVRAVRLRRDRIAVALERKVLVYNFLDLKLVAQMETASNTKGLLAVSSTADSNVIACPGLNPGQVRVDVFHQKQWRVIEAHDNELSCITLSLDGKRLATASEKGTLIRMWNTEDGTNLQVLANLPVQEIRRGVDRTMIYSIAFSRFCDFVAITSEKGLVQDGYDKASMAQVCGCWTSSI